MNLRYTFPAFMFAAFCFTPNASLHAQATHISNTTSVIEDGILNVQRVDASFDQVIDIIGIHRATAGTSQNGIGGSLVFRNEMSNSGFGLSGRISSIAVDAVVPDVSSAMRFDVYANGSTSNYLFLNSTGLGIGTSAPAAMLDILSPTMSPAHFRGVTPLWMGIYENGNYRGYLGSFSGADADVDFGTGEGNATGKLHLTIQALPKVTVDAAGKVGIATQTPTTILDVQGPANSTHVVRSTVNFSGNSDVRAVDGISTPAPGYGYGGHFVGGYRGVFGLGDGDDYSGLFVAGVYGQATGTAGTRIGIYGTATGGATNWAGFFASGNVFVQNELRIGDSGGATGYRLTVDGRIIAEELRIQNSAIWPDYVFAENYPLMDLTELEKSIKVNRHLPGIPPASIVENEGIAVGEMQLKMMEKIEELTLYIIQLHKEVEQLKEENAMIKASTLNKVKM